MILGQTKTYLSLILDKLQLCIQNRFHGSQLPYLCKFQFELSDGKNPFVQGIYQYTESLAPADFSDAVFTSVHFQKNS